MKKKLVLSALLLGFYANSHAKKIIIGGNGGFLSYPNTATALGVAAGDTIAIRPGVYTGFGFSNLKGTDARKIVITNDKGLVEFVNPCKTCPSTMQNVSNVVFTGSGAKNIEQGFYFHDLGYRAIQLSGAMDYTTISHARFERVADYTIFLSNNTLYDGYAANMVQGMKFLHLSFKKTGTPLNCGNYGSVADRLGVTRGFEVAYCKIDSLQGGDAFRFYKGFDVNIHHNMITNVGLNIITHNGVVYLKGDGQVHHNYFKNVWGNCMRGSGVGLNEVGDISFYNNICVGSRKYSAAELRTLPEDTSSRSVYPYTTICNYYVYNNTIGNQARETKLTAGNPIRMAMVDVYDFFGAKCIIRNNLGFNIEKDMPYEPNRNYIYGLQKSNKPDTSNNIYRRNFKDLGLIDTVNCFLSVNSMAIDKGLTISSVLDDYDGLMRAQGGKYDIGAREFVSIASGAKPEGTGLTAHYFRSKELAGTPLLTRIDPVVDFKWVGSPGTGVGENLFGVRWSGQVQPKYSENYTFYTKSDDGVRLYVDNVLLIDNWTNHAPIENSGMISLRANQLYDIRVEFYDNYGTAEMGLLWSSSNQPKQVISQGSLFPATAASLRSEGILFDEQVNTSSTVVYPMPVKEVLNIRYFSAASESADLSLVDGFSNQKFASTVDVTKGVNELAFGLNNLAPGLYILVIKSETKTESIKVIVQ